jgi:hypothetical protein
MNQLPFVEEFYLCVQIFTINATIVSFYFISLHQALHVSTTTGHPQVLQIFVCNYQTVTFTFTYVVLKRNINKTIVALTVKI